ncbi:MAG: hypothetical protein ACXVOI_08160, partial [Tumebacillaceae bacterium]
MKPFKRLTIMSAVTVFSVAILLLGGCGMPTKSQGVEQENRKGPGLVQRSMVQSQQAPTSVQVQTPSATSENAHQNIIAYKEVMQAVTDYLRHNGKDETCVAFQPDLTLPVFPRVMFGEVTLSKGEKKHVLLDRIQGVWTVEQLL